MKKIYTTPAEKQKAWRQSPKGIAYRRKWQKSEACKQSRKRWLQTHPGRMYQRRNAWKARRDLLYFYLKNKPCMDCRGWFEPCQMEFDHTRGVKIKTISQLRRGALKPMLEEVKKCDVVCANCHALRTYRRSLNAHKVRLTWDFGRNELSTRTRANKEGLYESGPLSNSR